MYKVGEEYLERLRGSDASVVDLLGMQQSPHMYALTKRFIALHEYCKCVLKGITNFNKIPDLQVNLPNVLVKFYPNNLSEIALYICRPCVR